MNWLTEPVGRFFDLLVGLVGGSPLLVMLVVSAITAVWALLLFKAVTPQTRLTRVRDRLFGHIYEMGLYQDRLRVVGRIQGDLAKANLRYLSLTLPALLVLTIPMVFTLAQLDSRFAHRPFMSGESTVFSVALSPDAALDLDDITLKAGPGVTVEAGPVRDEVSGAVAWRVRAEDWGTHQLAVLEVDREIGTRDLVVGEGLVRLGQSSNKDWLHNILFPGTPQLPGDGSLDEMTLHYPARHTKYLGVELHWMLAFMILSMVIGLAIKDVLRVSI